MHSPRSSGMRAGTSIRAWSRSSSPLRPAAARAAAHPTQRLRGAVCDDLVTGVDDLARADGALWTIVLPSASNSGFALGHSTARAQRPTTTTDDDRRPDHGQRDHGALDRPR